MSNINIVGLIVVIIILIVLYVILNNRTVDNFIVFLDDVIIPKTCWDYLVTNGKEYFLFNSKMIVDGINNPLKFPTKALALKHLETNKCPTNIPYVDLLMRKKNDDPMWGTLASVLSKNNPKESDNQSDSENIQTN